MAQLAGFDHGHPRSWGNVIYAESREFFSRSILKQTQASNQWAYYQAKSIKSYLYELQKEKLEGDLKLLGENPPKQVIDDLQKKIGVV